MDKPSTRTQADGNCTRLDVKYFRQPMPRSQKDFKINALVKRTIDKKTRIPKLILEKLNVSDLLSSMNSARPTGTIDQNPRIPMLVLKKLNVSDLLSYMKSAMTTEPESKGSIIAQSSMSEDWHLHVSTTSEEDFLALPIHRNVNVCDKMSNVRI